MCVFLFRRPTLRARSCATPSRISRSTTSPPTPRSSGGGPSRHDLRGRQNFPWAHGFSRFETSKLARFPRLGTAPLAFSFESSFFDSCLGALVPSPSQGLALLEGNADAGDAAQVFASLARHFSFASGALDSWADRPTKRSRLVPTLPEATELLSGDLSGARPEGGGGGGGVYPTVARVGFDASNANSAVEFVWQFPDTSPTAFRRSKGAAKAAGAFASTAGKGAGAATASAKEAAAKAAAAETAEAERLMACAEVLSALLEDAVFSELRTKQQLGYIVFSGLRVVDAVASLVIIVQSSQ